MINSRRERTASRLTKAANTRTKHENGKWHLVFGFPGPDEYGFPFINNVVTIVGNDVLYVVSFRE